MVLHHLASNVTWSDGVSTDNSIVFPRRSAAYLESMIHCGLPTIGEIGALLIAIANG